MQVTRFWNVYRSTWSTPILPFRSSGGQSTSEPLTSTAIQVQRGKNSPRAGEQLNATPAPRNFPSNSTYEVRWRRRHYECHAVRWRRRHYERHFRCFVFARRERPDGDHGESKGKE